jgi:hypothetical protein
MHQGWSGWLTILAPVLSSLLPNPGNALASSSRRSTAAGGCRATPTRPPGQLARRTYVERPRCESSPQFQQGAAPATFPTWVCLGLVVLALGSKHLRSGQLGSEFGVFSASPPTKYAAFNASKRGCKWVHFDLGTELFLLTC